MHCEISPESLSALRKKVAKEMLTLIDTNQKLDLKNLMTGIYNQIKKVTNDHAQALDYVRAVPMIIEQLNSTDMRFKKLLLTSAVDMNQLTRLIVEASEENGLEVIETFLGLKDDTTKETLKALNQAAQEEIDESKESERVIENPVSVPIQKRNKLQGIAANIRAKFFKAWQAVAPTFRSDGVLEAPYYDGSGKLIGANAYSGNPKIPYSNTAFYFGVKRALLQQMLDKKVENDSSELIWGDFEGIYLTAMNVSQIEIDPNVTDLTQDPNSEGVLLVLTDKNGTPIQFDTTTFQPVLTGGKIAYYSLRKIDDLIDNQGNVDNEGIRARVNALAEIRKAAGKKPTAEELSIAREQIKAEVLENRDIRNYINANRSQHRLQFKINGGSMGYIETSSWTLTPISKLTEDFTVKVATAHDAATEAGVKVGHTYLTAPGLYGQHLTVERPSVKEAGIMDLIIELLTEQLYTTQGRPLTYKARRELLRNYLNVSNPKEIIVSEKKDDELGYNLLLRGEILDLSTSDGIISAREKLTEFFNEKNKSGFYAAKMHINPKNIHDNNFTESSITDQGNKRIVSTKQIGANEFLTKYGYSVDTVDIGKDGKLRRTNAYFTFELTEESNNLLYGSAEEHQKEREQELEQKLEDVKPVLDNIPPLDTIEEDNIDDLLKDTWDSEELYKNVDQKNQNQKATEEQIAAAKVWYENHPLSKHIPFEVMFDKVNTGESNAVATWTLAGITLYRGSDYSDLYHEAWHGFTQTFLTKEQKGDLYNELRSKKGSFRDYNGHQVTFRYATALQLEEYLAEEFRKYMLNKQKPLKDSPKQNSFFRKIWNVLKALFQNANVRDITLDAKADSIVRDLFEKLRVGNLKQYSFNAENASFGMLNNKGITAIEDVTEGPAALNYQNSQWIVNMTDQFIAEYIDLENSRLTESQRVRLLNLEVMLRSTRVGPQMSQEERAALQAELNALKSAQTHQFTGRITKDRKMLANAYRYARSRFTTILSSLLDQVATETNQTKLALLQKDIQVLRFVLNHYGDPKLVEGSVSMNQQAGMKGVIGYHQLKSAVFLNKEVELDFENMSEDETFTKALRNYDRSGNETSLKELAKAEIIYLLKTLPKIDENGYVTDRLYVTELADFQKTWNILARSLQNIQDITQMYAKLVEISQQYLPVRRLLERMGPLVSEQSASEHNLWTSFWQTFNKTRVPLIQMTVTEEEIDATTSKFTARVGDASNTDLKVGRNWQTSLTAGRGSSLPYQLKDRNGTHLNVKKILSDFSQERAVHDPIGFYQAIGFDLSSAPEIEEAIKANPNLYSPYYFYQNLQTLLKNNARVENLDQIVGNETGRYVDLQKLEARYSDVFTNFMVTNAEGNTQFEHTLNNSLTMMVNSINNVENYQALISQPDMKHLDIDFNPFAYASTFLRSLFHIEEHERGTALWGKRREHRGRPVTVRLRNLSGVLIKKENEESGDGIASASADEYTKLIMDIHLSYTGFPEMMRHADKGTSFSITVDGPILGNQRSDDSYIPISDFATNEYKATTFDKLKPHLIAELKRMRISRNLLSSNVSNYDFKYLGQGQSFVTFDDVLSSETKQLLETIVKEDADIEDTLTNDLDLIAAIDKDFDNYFEKQYQQVKTKLVKASFIAENIKADAQKLRGIPVNKTEEAIVRAYVHNNWIHNIESIAVFYGDLALYNHQKEEFHKRNAGSGSTGTIYRTDSVIQDYINNNLYNNSYTAKNADRLGIKTPHKYTGQMKTAIVEDMKINSVYYKEYLASIEKQDPTNAQKKAGKYLEQNEADAQGLITFDAYRQLKVAEGSWSSAQEKLYQNIVDGKKVNPKEVLRFFPVIKAQYWGPLQTEHLPVTAFHKFSLFPMIPSVIKDKNMEKLHDKMIKEGISYITFASGSKVGTITKSQNSGPDKLYSEGHKLAPEILDLETDVPYFTPNVIHLKYLKNQLEIHDELKNKVIFSTQLRKLIEDGLMENGVPVDFMVDEKNHDKKIAAWTKLPEKKKLESKMYKLLKEYESNIDKLTQFAKQKLLEEIQWTSHIEQGTEILEGSQENLLRLVKQELVRQDLPDHSIDFLQVNSRGEIKTDLSVSLNVEQIEKLLNALMVKRLVKQKVNGEALIQVASTLMENFKESQEQNFKNPTAEDLAKYGSNGLPFYQSDGKTPTTAMKVKVALSGNFTHLLNALDNDGNRIGTIEQLNKMIKNDTWLNTGDNRRMITMVGVRIPVQGLNSMEFMEVYEFLPAEAGAVIIPPTEIVTKAGADFDVDKMTIMMPSIDTLNGKAELYKTGLAKSTDKQVLRKQKKEVREKIDEVEKKYDDIFLRRDKKKEFAFSDKERDGLEKLEDRIRETKTEISNLLDQWSRLSRQPYSVEVFAEMQEIESTLDTLYVKKGNLQETKREYLQTFKDERIHELNQAQEEELKPLKEELASVNRLLNSISDKAIQNDIITNIQSILSLPHNFNALITPNGTDLLDDIAKEMGEVKAQTEYNPLAVINGEPRTAEVKGKLKRVISPTRALEVGYNLYKHGSNNIGKQTLGLGAVDNTYNTLFNRIGAYMNPTTIPQAEYDTLAKIPAEKLTKEQRARMSQYSKQTIMLPHNTLTIDGQPAISLSHLKDANGENKISDVVNQMINGWVDIAKDAWIFNIQGNKEVSPVLLFMIQAGVPIKDAVYFVSNPLVREYVEQQKLTKSTFNKALGTAPEGKDGIVLTARKKIIRSSKYGFNVINPTKNKIANLISMLDTSSKFDTKTLQTRAKAKLSDGITQTDRDVFLHFLQLEDMSQAVRDVKMRTNVDTSRDTSLFAAQNRLLQLKDLEDNERLPSDLIDKLKTESPIGSFFIQDFQINLLGDLFPIRNHPVINQFLTNNLTKDDWDSTYKTQEGTIINWKSDLINYIFQNELKYFTTEGLTHYRSMGIETELSPVHLKHGAYVQDGKMYVDYPTLHQQYRDKIYNSEKYRELGYARVNGNAFNNAEEYIHFVMERELLRSQRPLNTLQQSKKFADKQKYVMESLGKKAIDSEVITLAYEVYLRDEALTRIYNHWQLFTSTNTFAQEFMRIQETYPVLANHFAIMSALSIRGKNGYQNLFVNDGQLDKDQLNILYENLHGKGDTPSLTNKPSLQNILPEATDTEINEIIEFFQALPIVAFLQSGMNTKSSFAMTPFVSQEQMLKILEEPLKRFMQLLEKNNDATQKYLLKYHQTFKIENSRRNRNRRIRGKNLVTGVSLMSKSGFKRLDTDRVENIPTNPLFISEPTDESTTVVPVTSYNTYGITLADAQRIGKANPNTIYIYNYATEAQTGATRGDHVFHAIPTAVGLPTLKHYVAPANLNMERPDLIRDINGKIDPKVKSGIDSVIEQLKLAQNAGKTLAFSQEGYGQEMLFKDKAGNRFAPQTFLYLSQQLYENFGYLNPKYLETGSGSTLVQLNQPVTDIMIKEYSDAAVRDFMKNCI